MGLQATCRRHERSVKQITSIFVASHWDATKMSITKFPTQIMATHLVLFLADSVKNQ